MRPNKVIVNATNGDLFYGEFVTPTAPNTVSLRNVSVLHIRARVLQPSALIDGPASEDCVSPRMPGVTLVDVGRVFALTPEAQEAWDRLIKGVERAAQMKGQNNDD